MRKNKPYILIILLSLAIIFLYAIVSVVFCSIVNSILNSFKTSEKDVMFWSGLIYLVFSYNITDKFRYKLIASQYLIKSEKRLFFRCTAIILSLIQLVEIPFVIKNSLYPRYLFFSLSAIIVIIMLFKTANWWIIDDNADENQILKNKK